MFIIFVHMLYNVNMKAFEYQNILFSARKFISGHGSDFNLHKCWEYTNKNSVWKPDKIFAVNRSLIFISSQGKNNNKKIFGYAFGSRNLTNFFKFLGNNTLFIEWVFSVITKNFWKIIEKKNAWTLIFEHSRRKNL